MADTLLSVASATAEQAYSDLLPRIQALEALSEDDLRPEMVLLKKALIENPDACALMLPQDVGQMVAALRRVTGQHLAAMAAKPKGGKKAAAKLLLTPEAIASAFDEL